MNIMTSAQITKDQIIDSINQLTAVVIGRKFAKYTNEYEENPKERIYESFKLIHDEQAKSFGDIRKSEQVQRKISSLQSLLLLTRYVDQQDRA